MCVTVRVAWEAPKERSSLSLIRACSCLAHAHLNYGSHMHMRAGHDPSPTSVTANLTRHRSRVCARREETQKLHPSRGAWLGNAYHGVVLGEEHAVDRVPARARESFTDSVREPSVCHPKLSLEAVASRSVAGPCFTGCVMNWMRGI